MSYQWTKGGSSLANGGGISGATSNVLTLANVQPADAGRYAVVVTNYAGSGTSAEVLLTIQYAQDHVFANANQITILDLSPASPYPSAITVTGLTGIVLKATVTLSNLSHTWPSDIDVLLAGPQSRTALLMSDAGQGAVAAQTLLFDDAAAVLLPQAGALVSGAYRPAAYGGSEVFATPAPAGPYGSTLASFTGANPNGTWSLFVRDEVYKDSGVIANGWKLSLNVLHTTTDNPSAPPSTVLLALSSSGPNQLTLSVYNAPAGLLQVWASTNLVNWTLDQTLPATGAAVQVPLTRTTDRARFYKVTFAP